MAPEPRQVEVYIKDGCELCDTMVAQLTALQLSWQSAFNIILREIEDSEEWYARYREYVPVLVVNGEEVCHYFLDTDEFKQALR